MIEALAAVCALCAVVYAFLFVLAFRERRRQRRGRLLYLGPEIRIVLTGMALWVEYPGKPLVSVGMLDKARRIVVRTTDQGPVLDDVFMHLEFDRLAIALPDTHPDWEKLYDALTACLPLDYHSFIAAMSSTDNAEFLIWSRPSDESGNRTQSHPGHAPVARDEGPAS